MKKIFIFIASITICLISDAYINPTTHHVNRNIDLITSLVRWQEATCLYFSDKDLHTVLQGDDREHIQHLYNVGIALKEKLFNSPVWTQLDHELLCKLASALETNIIF